jgi:hypothetical protein
MDTVQYDGSRPYTFKAKENRPMNIMLVSTVKVVVIRVHRYIRNIHIVLLLDLALHSRSPDACQAPR